MDRSTQLKTELKLVSCNPVSSFFVTMMMKVLSAYWFLMKKILIWDFFKGLEDRHRKSVIISRFLLKVNVGFL